MRALGYLEGFGFRRALVLQFVGLRFWFGAFSDIFVCN